MRPARGRGGDPYFLALQDAQDAADVLLDAEARLGGMLEVLPKKESYTGFQRRKSVLPEGITHKESYQAQTIGARPEPRMSQTTCTTSLKINLLFLNYPQRQGNNPGLSGAVFSVKVGNRVGKDFKGKN